MIKFFRKIRQNLLAKGKAVQYLKYAVGEIILVVIGILIALQINNWNEQRKDNAKEQAILKRLKKEFIANKEQLLEKIESRNDINKKCVRLLTLYNEPEKAELDSIILYFGSIIPTTFDPIQNDLVRSGNIEIVKSEELKQLLINWSTDVVQLREVEQMFLRYWETQFSNYTNEIGIQRDFGYSFWQKATSSMLEVTEIRNPIPGKSTIAEVSKEALLSDARLEGIITWSLNLNSFTNQESQTLLKRIDYILEVITAEIKE
ncbi:hypothetical protein SAMN04490243_1805 [Robiginitalea myxolifaciens]|uniref:Uncharacterized protein n=1 Tax=Robiginitalea myxolifaciens TaxID=400055 RepID=A0A1I6GVW3_9FLAO|nr:DUF6090 family protein [Robiginitalea myxolifaciens]SFR46403.1 hypothetical protein SAMN04490243_1805 [Robiginitalea myxolifaciens]